MTPIQYTFNGLDLTMGIEEQRAVENMGSLDMPKSGPRITLGEALAIMRLRPGSTEQEREQVLQYSKSDERYQHWHIDRGGCPIVNDRTINYPAFRSKYKYMPASCCAYCVKALRKTGDRNFGGEGEDMRFRTLRQRHTANAKKLRAMDGERLKALVARVKSEDRTPMREVSDNQLARLDKSERDSVSTSMGERSLDWGVSIGQMRMWKAKGIISGPIGRVWNYHHRPAMDGEVIDRSVKIIKSRGEVHAAHHRVGPKNILYTDGDRY